MINLITLNKRVYMYAVICRMYENEKYSVFFVTVLRLTFSVGGQRSSLIILDCGCLMELLFINIWFESLCMIYMFKMQSNSHVCTTRNANGHLSHNVYGWMNILFKVPYYEHLNVFFVYFINNIVILDFSQWFGNSFWPSPIGLLWVWKWVCNIHIHS